MMNFTYTRLLSSFASPVLRKHTRKFSHVLSAIKPSPLAGKICSRYFCEKPVDFYAEIEDDDFGSFEQTSSHKDVDFESIAKGDPEKMQMLKRIQLEIDVIVQKGGHIPRKISSTHWMELLSFPSKNRRQKYIHSLYCKEQRKLIKKREQELIRNELGELTMTKELRQHYQQLSTNSPLEYRLFKTSLFHRFYESDMTKLCNFRLLQASIFGPHLIIDCSFEEYMNQSELLACAKDMQKSWYDNRDHFYPYDIMFCNLHKNSRLFSRLSGALPLLETDPGFPFNFTDENYLDLFPKEQLVYLTPHCNEEMKSFDGNSIYIIGGLWDKSKDLALTLAKAKKEGIRKAKFPLDKYIKWTFGKKTLTISECVAIMNDLKDDKSWNFALRHLKTKQMSGRDLFDEGGFWKTDPKTANHFKERNRQKHV